MPGVEVGVEILAVGASLIAAIVWALKAVVASILKRSEEHIEKLIVLLETAVTDNRKVVTSFEQEERATHRLILSHLTEAHHRSEMVLKTLQTLLEVQRDILRIVRGESQPQKKP